MQQPVKRLIELFRPESYQLTINQDSDNLTFSGEVTINGAVPDLKAKTISLHASNLTISSVKIADQVCTYRFDEKAQELEIELPRISTCEITVSVQFSGTITRQMHGLYPCYYEHDGVEKRLLATQFESHHAREVFPCVDEPEAKAVFQLTLTTGIDDTVVSNTPIASTKNDEKLSQKTTSFEPTPKMSTYLLAWVSGEMIYEEATSKHGVVVRTYATPVHAGKLSFSVETACRALDFMDDYFAIPYPLTKCDQIALPDFAAGAMENWGCITYRESALLVDPEHSDLHDKQYAAEVIIHELSHQWFGNLVTMRWWNDLWLNEGFASWVPYLVREELFPDWNVWEHFATGDLAIGLRADALQNTHPIVVEINSPEEIRSAFDSISYDKGCSVINLLYHYIGAEAFRGGLRNYLKLHAYSNAETYDLWAAWDASSGQDVSGFMKVWTESPGFPLIEATSEGKSMSITQKRFLIDPGAKKSTTLWPIPLMRSSDDTTVLTEQTMTLQEAAKLNVGQSGFYRTIYKGTVRDHLVRELAAGKLSTADALGLIADTAEAAKAGYHSSTEILDLIASVRTSMSEQLVGTALGELAEMRTILRDSFEAQKPFVTWCIAPNLERLGIEKLPSDSVDDELLRPSILGAASYAGNEKVVDWALEQFDQADSPESLRPDIRGVIYQTAVRERNDQKTYEKLLAWYDATTIPGERSSLAAALASFRDEGLATRSLALITTDSVKLQDAMYWIAYSLRNRWNKQVAWSWIQKNWGWIAENYGKEKEIDYYLRFCASGFATEAHLKEYTEFFSSVDIFGSKRAFEQGKETIRWQSAWFKRDNDAILKALKDFTF